MENLPSCPCEDVRGSALSLKEQVMQDHVGRSEGIFHFSYIFWDDSTCVYMGENDHPLYHTIIIIIILHLCKLGAPGRTPVRSRSSSTQSDPAGRKEFSPALNDHHMIFDFWNYQIIKSYLKYEIVLKGKMHGWMCSDKTQKSCNSVSRVKKSTLFLQSHGSWTLRALLSPP